MNSMKNPMRIVEINLRPLAMAFKQPYHWAGRVDYGTANLLVEVVTDEGITGYGEVIAARPAEVALRALEGVRPRLLGSAADDAGREGRNRRP